MFIKSLSKINLNDEKFPIFFRLKWMNLQKDLDHKSDFWIYHDIENQSLIPIRISKIKFLKTGKYLYKPLNLAGNEFDSYSEKKILDKFHIFIENKIDIILPPEHYINFKSIPSKVQYYPLGILFIDLSKDIDCIKNSMNSSFRSKIRQAEKNQVKIEFSLSKLSTFYKAYEFINSKQKLYIESIDFFKLHTEKLVDNIIIGTSEINNELESAIFCISDSYKCYFEYGGVMEKPHFSGSNKLLFLELIKELKISGHQELVLGGYRENVNINSKLHGIQTFKIRLGAVDKPGYHFLKIFKPNRYKLFVLLLQLKSLIKKKEFLLVNLQGLDVSESN
jgi:hypothetical protein